MRRSIHLTRRRLMISAAATGVALARPGPAFAAGAAGRIDRKALVTRHNPIVRSVD